MFLWCLPSIFSLIQLTVWEEMSFFEEFQDGHNSYHLGYGNQKIFAILNLHVSSVHPPSFGFHRLIVPDEMLFEDFLDDRHGSDPGFRNKMILTMLNHYVAPMPPTKFQLNPTYESGDVKNVKLKKADKWTTDRWMDRQWTTGHSISINLAFALYSYIL